jgi:hypothetical protein
MDNFRKELQFHVGADANTSLAVSLSELMHQHLLPIQIALEPVTKAI